MDPTTNHDSTEAARAAAVLAWCNEVEPESAEPCADCGRPVYAAETGDWRHLYGPRCFMTRASTWEESAADIRAGRLRYMLCDEGLRIDSAAVPVTAPDAHEPLYSDEWHPLDGLDGLTVLDPDDGAEVDLAWFLMKRTRGARAYLSPTDCRAVLDCFDAYGVPNESYATMLHAAVSAACAD